MGLAVVGVADGIRDSVAVRVGITVAVAGSGDGVDMIVGAEVRVGRKTDVAVPVGVKAGKVQAASSRATDASRTAIAAADFKRLIFFNFFLPK